MSKTFAVNQPMKQEKIMTLGAFELFEIQCADFRRNLHFFRGQSSDKYVQEMLDDLVALVSKYEAVIGEAVPGSVHAQ